MGAESYFITLLPTGISPAIIDGANGFKGKTDIKVKDFIEKIKQMKYPIKSIKEENWFWFAIDDAIVMRLEHQDGWIQALSLEGCFSWYVEGLQLCYEITRSINDNILKVQVYHPLLGLNFTLGTIEEFLIQVKNVYQDKYERFIREFGEIHGKVQPGMPFFDFRKKSKRKSLFSRLFK